MRVGLVCPYSLSVPGGVQGQVMGLAEALLDRGHAVRVLAPCDGPPPSPIVTPLGVSIPTATNGSVAPLAPDPPCALRTLRAMRAEAFDVVHLHEPLAPGATMTALLAGGSPLVGTFHAAGDLPAYFWMRPALRWAAKRLDAPVAVSQEAAAAASTVVDRPVEVLWNGVEVPRFATAPPWPAEGPTVFFVGRHEPRKGLAVLLEALRRLPLEVRVWIAGEGPETDALRAGAGRDPRARWLGPVSDEEKASRLRGAQVFCAPSLSGESFGVVLLEAMAAGTPIVASDLPGYRKVARPGHEALLVDPGNADALADALRTLLDASPAGEARRASLVEAGRARAEELSMDRLAGAYEAIYERVRAARADRSAVGARPGRRPGDR